MFVDCVRLGDSSACRGLSYCYKSYLLENMKWVNVTVRAHVSCTGPRKKEVDENKFVIIRGDGHDAYPVTSC
jgi:hypothetical protein